MLKEAIAATALVSIWAAAPARGQSLADRIAETANGRVLLSYAAKPGVCGNGKSISIGKWSTRDGWCDPGPARVELRLEGGRVQYADLKVGGSWGDRPDALQLGRVSAAEASGALLSLAREAAAGAEDLVMAGVIADSAAPARSLLELAEGADAKKIRESALFWLSAEAGEAVMRRAGYPAETEEDEIASAAVFALSQRDEHTAVAALTRVVRGDASAHVKKDALFWLGQTGSPEAVGVIAEVLGL